MSRTIITLPTLIICTIIFISRVPPGQPLSFTEGEAGELLFYYDYVPNGEIELRMGYRLPFYKGGRLYPAGLSSSQMGRFTVQEEQYVPSLKMLVRISLSNVAREDAGTITLNVIINGALDEDSTQRIGVEVLIPPGKAYCRPANNNIHSIETNWTTINCYATLGTEPGLFECYQSSELMPQLSRLTQNKTTLMQTVLMKKSLRIHCCTSMIGHPKGECDCSDYVWNPTTRRNMNGVIPCQVDEPEATTFPEASTTPSPSPTPTTIPLGGKFRGKTISPEEFRVVFKIVYTMFGVVCFSAVLLSLVAMNLAFSNNLTSHSKNLSKKLERSQSSENLNAVRVQDDSETALIESRKQTNQNENTD